MVERLGRRSDAIGGDSLPGDVPGAGTWRLERAEAVASALGSIGVAAAVVSPSGRVLATNALLEAMRATFIAAANGCIALANAAANARLQDAIARSLDKQAAQTIPVPASAGQPPLVVHLSPLPRTAGDLFSGPEILACDILAVTTPVSTTAMMPSASLLADLFGLTPAETRLAAALSRGLSLKEAASDSNITFKTGRTYLDRVFAKTGTHHQSELVALLKSAERVSGPRW